MKIIGGAPPFIEDENPKFGGLLLSLNRLRIKLETKHAVEATEYQQSMVTLNQAVIKLTDRVGTIIPGHIAERGAVHGETALTIHLSHKENYRDAVYPADYLSDSTTTFVTPNGASQAIENTISGYNKDNFQKQLNYPFASLYLADQFERVERESNKVHYYKPGKVSLALNGDRILLSPQFNDQTPPFSVYLSETTAAGLGTLFAEQRLVKNYYRGLSYNTGGLITNDGKVAIFKPLINRNIYNYQTDLNTLRGSTSFLFNNLFGSVIYRGLAVNAYIENNRLNFFNLFFYADNPEVNPIIRKAVNDTYMVELSTPETGNTPRSVPLNNLRVLSFAQLFDIGPGVSIRFDTSTGDLPVVSTVWRTQNQLAISNISIGVIITINGTEYARTLSYSESINGGTLAVGGEASIISLSGSDKEPLHDLQTMLASTRLIPRLTNDLLDLTTPGIVTQKGDVYHAIATHSLVYVKYGNSSITLLDKLLAPKTTQVSNSQITRVFSPLRYIGMGVGTRRVVPFQNSLGFTTYIVNCLDETTGLFGYREYSWAGLETITYPEPTRAAFLPQADNRIKVAAGFPKSLAINSGPAGGVNIRSLSFTRNNSYTGHRNLSYNAGVTTLTNPVKVSQHAEAVISYHLNKMMERSAAQPQYQSGVLSYKREAIYGIHVFGPISDNRCLIYLSDGLSHVEALIIEYVITANNEIDFDINYVSVFTKVSNATTANLGNRKSKTNDDNVVDASDLLLNMIGNSYQFVLTQPFGELSGDVSFTYANNTKVLTPVFTNPAHTYPANEYIDLSPDFYPALLIPRNELYQNRSSSEDYFAMKPFTGNATLYPFRSPTSRIVALQEGFSVILNGKSVTLDRIIVETYDSFPKYFYLESNAGVYSIESYDTLQQPSNNAVLFAMDRDGLGVTYNNSYIVVDSHLLSSERMGGVIPIIPDDGTQYGTTDFFKYKDVFRNPLNGTGMWDYHWIQQFIDHPLVWTYYDLDGVAYNPDNYALGDLPPTSKITLRPSTNNPVNYPYFKLQDTPNAGVTPNLLNYSINGGASAVNPELDAAALPANNLVTVEVKPLKGIKGERIYTKLDLIPLGDWRPPHWMSKVFAFQHRWYRDNTLYYYFHNSVDTWSDMSINLRTGEVFINLCANKTPSETRTHLIYPGAIEWQPGLWARRNCVQTRKVFPELIIKDIEKAGTIDVRIDWTAARHSAYISQRPSRGNDYTMKWVMDDNPPNGRADFAGYVYVTTSEDMIPYPLDDVTITLVRVDPITVTPETPVDSNWVFRVTNGKTTAVNNLVVDFTLAVKDRLEGDKIDDLTFSHTLSGTASPKYQIVNTATRTVSIPAGQSVDITLPVYGNLHDNVVSDYDDQVYMTTSLTYQSDKVYYVTPDQHVVIPDWYFDDPYLDYNIQLPADGTITIEMLTGQITTTSSGWGGEWSGSDDFKAYPGPVVFNPGISGQGYRTDTRTIPALARPTIGNAPDIQWSLVGANGPVGVVQQPTLQNGFVGIVQFYDNGKYEYRFVGNIHLKTPMVKVPNPLDQLDVTLVQVKTPAPTVSGADRQWEFKLKNNGTTALTNVSVEFMLGGATPDDDSSLTMSNVTAGAEPPHKYAIVTNRKQTVTLAAGAETTVNVNVYGNITVDGTIETIDAYDVNVKMTVFAVLGNNQKGTVTLPYHLVFMPEPVKYFSFDIDTAGLSTLQINMLTGELITRFNSAGKTNDFMSFPSNTVFNPEIDSTTATSKTITVPELAMPNLSTQTVEITLDDPTSTAITVRPMVNNNYSCIIRVDAVPPRAASASFKRTVRYKLS